MEEENVHFASQSSVVFKDQISNTSRSYFSKTDWHLGINMSHKISLTSDSGTSGIAKNYDILALKAELEVL